MTIYLFRVSFKLFLPIQINSRNHSHFSLKYSLYSTSIEEQLGAWRRRSISHVLHFNSWEIVNQVMGILIRVLVSPWNSSKLLFLNSILWKKTSAFEPWVQLKIVFFMLYALNYEYIGINWWFLLWKSSKNPCAPYDLISWIEYIWS